LDRHFLEYQEKLAAFKAANTAVTAIPLAEEVLRIAIVRNSNLAWVIVHLNWMVDEIIYPFAFVCCPWNSDLPMDPPTQMSNLVTALHVAQKELAPVKHRRSKDNWGTRVLIL